MHISIRQPQDLEQLRDKIRQESNSKQRDRYRAVLLALEGLLTNTIMQMLGRSKNFVQRWSYAYRDGGIEAITPGRPTGRPSKLMPFQEQQFRQRMLDGPYEPKMFAISLSKNLGFNTAWQGSMIYYIALACHAFNPDPSIGRMILMR